MAAVYVGLISGTSMDGIDAVVADFAAPQPRLLAALTQPFDPTVQEELDRLRLDPDHYPVGRMARLDAILADRFAVAALAAAEQAGLPPERIRAIGSHGQTVLHRPDASPPHTLQIGDPHRIAAQTGIVVVADFRRADMAAGGQAAPLAPLLHQALLARAGENRVVINLGGIANITLLGASGTVSGFDTGPANCFLDWWYRQHYPERFDQDGQWAAGGRVDADWLERLLADPYFKRPAPKSTGIEYFSIDWLKQRLPAWSAQRARDVQATLAELTAMSVVHSIQAAMPGSPDRVLLCGGGAHNNDLAGRIHRHLPESILETTEEHGLPADFVEAMLFAWLARERLAERFIDSGPVTGARWPVLLGSVHRPAR